MYTFEICYIEDIMVNKIKHNYDMISLIGDVNKIIKIK